MLCRYPALWHRIFEHWAPLSCILTYCHVNHPFCNVTCLVYIHLNFWRVIAELSSRSHWFSCWLSAQDVAQCCSFQLAELSMEHNLCTIANQIAHSDSLSALLRLRLHQLISAPSEVLGLSGGGLRLHNCRPSSKDSSETQCFNLHNSTRHQAIIYIYLLCARFSIVFHHRSYGPTGAPMTDALIFFSPGSLRWSNLSFEPEDRSPPSVENDAHRHGTTVSKANGLASLLKFVAGKKCAEDIFGPTDQCSGRLSKETLHSGIYIFLYTTYVHTCIIHIYIYVYICRYIYIYLYIFMIHTWPVYLCTYVYLWHTCYMFYAYIYGILARVFEILLVARSKAWGGETLVLSTYGRLDQVWLDFFAMTALRRVESLERPQNARGHGLIDYSRGFPNIFTILEYACSEALGSMVTRLLLCAAVGAILQYAKADSKISSAATWFKEDAHCIHCMQKGVCFANRWSLLF